MVGELHMEAGHNVTRREGVNAYSNNIATTIVARHEIFDQNKIANGHNKFFARIGPKIASLTPVSSRDFKQCINVSETVLQNIPFKVKN